MSFNDALSNLMPMDWFDPYGRTPMAMDPNFNLNADMSVDITIVETDNGIRASSVKTPPREGPNRLMQAIQNALGVDSIFCEPPCSSPQAADQGKHDKQNSCLSRSGDSDKMESSSSGNSSDRDRNPGSQGSRPEPSHYGATEEEDAKKKPRE